MNVKYSTSKTAEKLAGCTLKKQEWLLLNYLVLMEQRNNSVSSAALQDWIRGKCSYKEILNFFENTRIITGKTGFVYSPENPSANRCRKFFINKKVSKEILSGETTKTIKKNLELSELFKDNSNITDDDTRQTLEALNQLTLNKRELKDAVVNPAGFLILKKFVNEVRNVRKSPVTGRICHILLNAGSREVRQYFRYNGKKPLEIDGKCFHFQLVQKYLNPEDKKILGEWLKGDFYTEIMKGTGLTCRDTVKKKCQQVLTNKKLGKAAERIREFLFLRIPSLETFCREIWAEGMTVQRFLQKNESDFINDVCRKIRKAGFWVLSFYDGFWIEGGNKEALAALEKAVSQYRFERK